jgi:hypothetical protein
MSVRRFAEELGVAVRTVSKWEKLGANTRPRPDTQAILDTAWSRLDVAQRALFSVLVTDTGKPASRVGIPANGAPDYEAWSDDLDRVVNGLGHQSFKLATGLLHRWLSRFTFEELDPRGLALRARSLVLLGDVRRDQGILIGPKSARHAYGEGLRIFGDLDIPRRIAQVELSLAVVAEMSGNLRVAAERYAELAQDDRLDGRDRARAQLWIGTALTKVGDHDQATKVMTVAAHAFEELDEPEEWSVAHQKLALAHRGAGRLVQALKCIDVALTSGVDDSAMQRVQLQAAQGHVLASDPATREEGIDLLERSSKLALQYGLGHQLSSIAAIRRQLESACSAPTARMFRDRRSEQRHPDRP